MRDISDLPQQRCGALEYRCLQRILRLVVEQLMVTEDQIMIKYIIPISDVRLRCHQNFYRMLRSGRAEKALV